MKAWCCQLLVVLCLGLATEARLAATQEAKPLVFLSDADYPPITYLEGGTPKGVAVDLVKALSGRMGRPIEIHLIPWQEAQDLVLRDKADALFPMSITETRKQDYDFSDPMLELQFSIFIRTDYPGISGAADLRGQRVGVTPGGLPRQLLKADPGIRLVPIADYSQGFQMLKDGQVDAVVADQWVGGFVLAKLGLSTVRIAGDPLIRLHAAVAVKKGNAAVLRAVNDALRAMQADGTIDRITANWRPKEVLFLTHEQLQHWEIVGAFGLLVLVLLGVVLWLVALRREVLVRRRADKQIVTLNQRLSLATRSAGIGIWDWDVSGDVLVWDEEMYRIYQAQPANGSTAHEVWSRAVHVDDRVRVQAEVQAALRDQTHLHSEFRITWPDGTVRTILSVAETFRGADGRPLRMVGVNYDITERKLAEEQLRARTAFFEAQVDSALDGILVVDNTGRKVLQNRRMAEVWKIPREILDDPDDAKQVQFGLRTKNPQQFAEKVAYLYSHPTEISRDEIALVDGTVLDRYSAPVRDAQGKHYGRIWAFRDITEQRRLEEQLRHSQKMDAIGQLSGGIAHDFNNLLTAIIGNLGLLKNNPQVTPQIAESLGEISAAANRAANLTSQLLAFSRRQVISVSPLDLNEVVTNLTKMLRRVLGEQVAVQLDFAQEELTFQGDAGMMEQVLVNLAVNARDAMPQGGTLRITTRAETRVPPAMDGVLAAGPGEFVRLSVGDTGTGISREIRSRIFEPFFTTKGVGKGTGLGLATVFGIMQQHHGWIEVESEAGRGTTFHLYLPRLARPPADTREKEPAQPVQPARGRGELVLVVEDETMVQQIVMQALGRYGYRVVLAGNGPEALKIWAERKAEIALLLTDLIMPEGISGLQLARQLLAEKPLLRVVYTSGYSAEIAGKEMKMTDGVNYLAKPYELDQLFRTVRLALDRKQSHSPF